MMGAAPQVLPLVMTQGWAKQLNVAPVTTRNLRTLDIQCTSFQLLFSGEEIITEINLHAQQC